VLGAITYVALYLFLQPWLNASSDRAFFGAVALLGLVLAFTVIALLRAIWGRPRLGPPKSSKPSDASARRDGEARAEPDDSKVVH
jgi:hypothetical protein